MILSLIRQKLALSQWQTLLEKIHYFECNYDKQFKSIEKIIQKFPDQKSKILFWIIQNALVSFQLSWNWENRREEFSNYVINNLDIFLTNNFTFRKNLLSNCKNNQRFKKLKLQRIKKSLKIQDIIKNHRKNLYHNMINLNKLLSEIMNQPKTAKTIVFAVKMFGYWARINYKFIPYPFEIDIPVDSRITKIYLKEKRLDQATPKEIRNYFRQLSRQIWLPPLHLDSLLWVK